MLLHPRTREELSAICRVSPQTIASWCKGWHLYHGTKIYFFQNHRRLKPLEGRGVKSDPYLYEKADALSYKRAVLEKRYTRVK